MDGGQLHPSLEFGDRCPANAKRATPKRIPVSNKRERSRMRPLQQEGYCEATMPNHHWPACLNFEFKYQLEKNAL
jgi:hypothetical protein